MKATRPCSVVILGMPRSGTSLTASIFVRAGFHAGEGLRPADAANPLGYYQSEDLTNINARLFQRVGYPHHNTWLHEPITAEALARLDDLEPLDEHRRFLADFEAHAPWVWKDPRMCMTLGFWRQLLDFNTTRALVVRRNPAAIYHSFIVQNFMKERQLSRDEFFARVDQHIAHARATIARYGIPAHEIWYEDLVREPERVVREIAAFVGAELRPEHVDVRRELNHSSLRNRLAWRLVALARRSPRARRLAKAVLPRPIAHWLMPERRHLQDSAGASAR